MKYLIAPLGALITELPIGVYSLLSAEDYKQIGHNVPTRYVRKTTQDLQERKFSSVPAQTSIVLLSIQPGSIPSGWEALGALQLGSGAYSELKRGQASDVLIQLNDMLWKLEKTMFIARTGWTHAKATLERIAATEQLHNFKLALPGHVVIGMGDLAPKNSKYPIVVRQGDMFDPDPDKIVILEYKGPKPLTVPDHVRLLYTSKRYYGDTTASMRKRSRAHHEMRPLIAMFSTLTSKVAIERSFQSPETKSESALAELDTVSVALEVDAYIGVVVYASGHSITGHFDKTLDLSEEVGLSQAANVNRVFSASLSGRLPDVRLVRQVNWGPSEPYLSDNAGQLFNGMKSVINLSPSIPLVVVVIANVGSGKSTLGKLLEERNIRVFENEQFYPGTEMEEITKITGFPDGGIPPGELTPASYEIIQPHYQASLVPMAEQFVEAVNKLDGGKPVVYFVHSYEEANTVRISNQLIVFLDSGIDAEVTLSLRRVGGKNIVGDLFMSNFFRERTFSHDSDGGEALSAQLRGTNAEIRLAMIKAADLTV
jgi:hypothetical protein